MVKQITVTMCNLNAPPVTSCHVYTANVMFKTNVTTTSFFLFLMNLIHLYSVLSTCNRIALCSSVTPLVKSHRLNINPNSNTAILFSKMPNKDI